MLHNYLTIAWRNLRKHRHYAFINVASLALGIAGCLLILLFVREELSFDRFHEQASRMYRLVAEEEGGLLAVMPPTLGPALASEVPEISHAVRFLKRDDVLLSRERGPVAEQPVRFYENDFLYTDSTFFEVFSFSLVQGHPETALSKPFSLVLTEEMAQKYFPGEAPVGKTLLLQNTHPFEITGVVRAAPSNSSLRFNFLASFSTLNALPDEAGMLSLGWRVAAYPTYVLLAPEASSAAVEKRVSGVLERHTDRDSVLRRTHRLEALTDLHLFAEAQDFIAQGSDIRYVYIFSAVAFLLLFIGGINYVNLTTAQSARRLREIGVRKMVGAKRSQLIGQFLSESVLLSFLALLLSLVVLELFLPLFRELIQRDIRIDYLGDAPFWLGVLGLAGGVGVLAGSYPALLLSGFRPIGALKGRQAAPATGRRFRKGLVVIQFAVSVVLIISILAIQGQLDYVRAKRLGLDQERLVVLPLKRPATAEQAVALAQDLRSRAYVRQVALSSSVPTRPHMGVRHEPEGEEEVWAGSVNGVDPHFLDTYGMELVSGRGFSEAFTDASGHTRLGGAVINEAAARRLGWEDPVGQTLPIRPNGHQYAVVGVVKDFHFTSLREEIEPLILTPLDDFWTAYVSLKLGAGPLPDMLASVAEAWDQAAPGLPFDYFFLDDAFDQLYKADDRFARIFSAFTLTAILVACLGLFGLAAFMAEQRTKEIGIRKVLGASVSSIVLLLSRELLLLVGVAGFIAAPIAYVLTLRWLEDFAYHLVPGPGLFIVAGAAALLVALTTVGYQSIKTARADPVKSLRYE